MKTHEHAIISLGYAAIVSASTGQGLGSWEIYLAAVIGGEIIDFIDHPLYHLVYNRNEPHVVEARKIFRKQGFKAAVSYLNDVEEKRKFKGLLLHNVYSLSFFALLAIVATLFLSGQTYFFVGLGAFLLHMFTDLWGDFKRLGHIDNWLWVFKRRTIDLFGRMDQQKLVTYILVWVIFTQIAFALITIRWAWQLVHSTSIGLVYETQLHNIELLAYVPLAILFIYHLNIIGIWVANIHKYKLEIENPENVRFSIGSFAFVKNLMRRKVQWNRQNFERTYLRMQADQAVWTIFLVILIAFVLTALSWFLGASSQWANEQRVFFILIPVFLALLFGTMIHTTVGEFGGVWGVLLAILVNLFLGRLGLQEIWEVNLGYWLFGAAIGAWVLGLLGGIILKGQSRMSVVVFSIKFEPTSINNSFWLEDVLLLPRT